MSLIERLGDPATIRSDAWTVCQEAKSTLEAQQDQIVALREAAIDIRNRILCPVGPSPTLDEIERIASAALETDGSKPCTD